LRVGGYIPDEERDDLAPRLDEAELACLQEESSMPYQAEIERPEGEAGKDRNRINLPYSGFG